jgi:hypothetical protein
MNFMQQVDNGIVFPLKCNPTQGAHEIIVIETIFGQ